MPLLLFLAVDFYTRRAVSVRPRGAARLRSPALRAAVLLLLLGLAATPGRAQTPPPAADSAATARFRLADSYLRAGQFDRAIALLEDLRAANPGTPVFFDRLKDAYEGVKRYDDAIALVEERLARQQSTALMAEKARLLYRKGDEDAALQTWQAAVALAPETRLTYTTVYNSLVDARLFTQALAIMEQGREALGAPDAFRLEMAYLYSFTSQYDKAVREYVALLKEDPRRLALVQRRLGSFLEDEEALQKSIAAVSRAVREDPLSRPLRQLQAYLYLEDGQYGKALDASRAIDRLEGEGGRLLFRFAQQAADAGAYEAALQAYRLVLDKDPDAALAAEAQRGLGAMYVRRAEQTGDEDDYEKALQAYRAFLEAYPNNAAYPSVLRAVGGLQQDVLGELDAAKETLQEVAARYPHTQAADEAQYDLGRLALMRGDLGAARLAFSRLAERLRTGDLAGRARYELALLQFYEGAFDAAATLAAAVSENASDDIGNDAIQLKVLIQTSKGPDSTNAPLGLYARARLQQRQRQPAAALQALDTLLTQYGRHALADRARFLRAEVLRADGRYEEAAAAFAEIPLMFPRSPLADRSLFAAAQLEETALDRPDAALETYARLLADYPGSLLLADARARIRALRGDQESDQGS